MTEDIQVIHIYQEDPYDLVEALEFMGYKVDGIDPYDGSETGVWFRATEEERVDLWVKLSKHFNLA